MTIYDLEPGKYYKISGIANEKKYCYITKIIWVSEDKVSINGYDIYDTDKDFFNNGEGDEWTGKTKDMQETVTEIIEIPAKTDNEVKEVYPEYFI